MGILADWQIRRDIRITPFAEGEKRKGRISFGLSSYGYDARLGYKFKVFKPYPCAAIDPKNFDRRMLEDVDLTPFPTGHDPNFILPQDEPKHQGYYQCVFCNQFWDAAHHPEKSKDNCPIRPRTPDHLLIPPHSFVLGETLEEFDIPRDVLCVVLGKSTYARCGLVVNVTPGEPEWKGRWTIELSNTTPLPLKVYPGEGIMQCLFFRSDGVMEKLINWLLVKAHNMLGRGWFQDDENEFQRVRGTGACVVSYADKAGKYQNAHSLDTPKVDK